MMDAQALISTRDLAIGYRGRAIARAISLEVRAGDFWFPVRPNGTGKTTLVRTVLGLVPPVSGALQLGAALGGLDAVGFVPQRSELPPSVPMTVREFVRLGFVGLACYRDERAERAASALALVGLTGRERDGMQGLSGGLRQRTVLARALVRDPKLLILDEPTNHLDPASEDAFLELLLRLNNETRTAVMIVTHDLDVVARMATHVALFSASAVVAGERESVLTEENLAALLGREDVNPVVIPSRLGGHD